MLYRHYTGIHVPGPEDHTLMGYGPPRPQPTSLKSAKVAGVGPLEVAILGSVVVFDARKLTVVTFGSWCFRHVSKVSTDTGTGPPGVTILVTVITFRPLCGLGICKVTAVTGKGLSSLLDLRAVHTWGCSSTCAEPRIPDHQNHRDHGGGGGGGRITNTA